MNEDRRLIEDYLPIKAISKEASREKSVRKGHISTLHLWWARRPLVACRAAVYGALVPADQFRPKNGPSEKRKSLGRANAAKFLERLCKYPGNPQVIKEAQRHILEAHAERLTKETGKKVTLEDIEEGRAPRPKVLDMFAGGGSIPLEALRLGCEAYALELNPVAHIIELCTLVYPQKYGKPDSNMKGMTGPRNDEGETTWGGLANEVRYWGKWILEKVRKEIGDLYPPIPDPEYKGERPEIEFRNGYWLEKGKETNQIEEWANVNSPPEGYLKPVAYLWTRTVKCKNPICGATVPLLRHTWLCKKKPGKKSPGRYIALKKILLDNVKRVKFEVVKATDEKELRFDPSIGSKGGNATCPFCGTLADIDYVKTEGCAKRMEHQMIAVVCNRSTGKGKRYLNIDQAWERKLVDSMLSLKAINIAKKYNLLPFDEPLEPNPRSFDVQHFGFNLWKDIFTERQFVAMSDFAGMIKTTYDAIIKQNIDCEHAQAINISLSSVLGRLADYCTSFCIWAPEFIAHMYSDPGLPMIMDFAEVNPLAFSSGGWPSALDYLCSSLSNLAGIEVIGNVQRGSSLSSPYEDRTFDAVITDPPYYDSRSYSNLSDHFYVWHKRSIGHILPEHFGSILTPKKAEAIAASYRHGGNRIEASESYERMMQKSFEEANRVLKPKGSFICVYAHKTTSGWTTLINALKKAGFSVYEAWPVGMERKTRKNAQNTAALASSIFLVARKRDGASTGSFENQVRSELQQVVQERVETLWDMGVAGADLVIAAVGAGLRAFTQFSRVEYANGEEVPAEHFLAEVETVVLESILKRLSKEVGANSGQFSLAGVDAATRFYILWRYTYKYSVLDAGEAIVFANGTHVELDGPNGMSTGARALLEKKKGKYSLKDFSNRGSDKKLCQMTEDGQTAPMIDALHRTLWLMEKRPGELPTFLQEAQPNREQMRLVAQALAGPALKGGELADISPHAELSALAKLTANWNSVIEGSVVTVRERKAEEAGQTSWLK